MKHGKNPTVKQKKFLKERRLNYENWLVVSDAHDKMIIRHRHTDTERMIYK